MSKPCFYPYYYLNLLYLYQKAVNGYTKKIKLLA